MIKTLEKVVTECGWLARNLRATPMDEQDKVEQLGAHFSTRVDRESQALGLRILHEAFPGEIVVAEEQENETVIPADCTVFDPLDGTTNYFNGIHNGGVTLCTLCAHQPTYSATSFLSGEPLITAIRGQGCYRGGFSHGRQIRSIPWHGQLDKTQFATDIGSWCLNQGTFDTVLRPLAERFNILSSMAAVEGARKVLLGQVGAYYNFGIAKIWDAAGMALAIQEAGGVVCDPHGNPLRWDTVNCDWIMAGNQQLADIILEHSRHWPGRKG